MDAKEREGRDCIMSNLMTSYLIYHITSHHIILHHIILYHILLHLIILHLVHHAIRYLEESLLHCGSFVAVLSDIIHDVH